MAEPDRFGMPGWYKGTRFRSHLEARYAIFFDELQIKWEYEPQGFAVDGTAYLPDFVAFPALGMLWIEIKPEWDTDPAGVERWRKFVAHRPQPSRAALLIGKPSADGMHTVIGGDEGEDPLKGPWEDDRMQWRPCPAGYHFDLAYPGKYRTKFADDGCPDHFGGPGEDLIEAAVKTALGYRFGKFGSGGTAA